MTIPTARPAVRTEPAPPILRLEGVGLCLDERRLFEGVNLVLERGRAVWISGPSGLGKTMLLKGIVRLHPHLEGRIRLEDLDAGELDPVQLRSRVMYLHQTPARYGGSLAEELELFAGLNPDRALGSEEREGLRVSLGLGHLDLGASSRGLSGGELLRFGLLRLLVSGPDVLLIDEPFASLDPAAAEAVRDTLRRWMEAGGSGLMGITHNLDPLGPGDGEVFMLGPEGLALGSREGGQVP